MAQEGSLFVVHTSDTHSCIEPISPNFSDTAQADKGGYLRRVVLLEQLRKEHPDDLLLFDCGDFSQGSAYYNIYKGEVEVKLMKSDTQLPEKERIVKETVRDSFFDALDFGFVWLERALKG